MTPGPRLAGEAVAPGKVGSGGGRASALVSEQVSARLKTRTSDTAPVKPLACAASPLAPMKRGVELEPERSTVTCSCLVRTPSVKVRTSCGLAPPEKVVEMLCQRLSHTDCTPAPTAMAPPKSAPRVIARIAPGEVYSIV